jgi:defect-in-organelle-trafficking protein DotC
MREKLILAIVVTASLLSACSTSYIPPDQKYDTTNLNDLENISETVRHDGETGKAADSQLRYKALEEIGMTLGAQGGLASASQGIDTSLDRDHRQLEALFNFNGMILSHGVMPPVLVQSDTSLNLADPDTIRIADKSYKIIKQARFVTAPPNWRDYLWQTYEKPDMPHKVLLPTNAEERRIWRRAIKVGWEKGTQQAYNIFQQNLALLKRDYAGMILYRKLLQMKMINAPYVSRTELGVTGNSENMRINDQVLRITELPQLQIQPKNWKAIVVKQ